MKEPNAKQQEVINLIENLVRVTSRYGVVLVGFAFRFEEDSPIFINFGNCSDAADIKLYEKLVEFREDQIKRGSEPTKMAVEEVN